jgi:hypothetical protein
MAIKRIMWCSPLLIGGAILIVLGLIIYAVKGFAPVLTLPIIGAVIIVASIIYQPKSKP